ncbi:MAG: hypothetical protein HY579_14035 [Nitrospinae bacterium]|nr:hypothetical protein [Nitrospinota bacterium]
MRISGVRFYWNGILFLLLLAAAAALEFYGHIFERGIGYYLKWQNPHRQQLGRVWDKERKNILAQSKVQTILSSLDLKEQSSESIESFRALFETLHSSLAVSREKFLQLYFDYPGQWSHRIVSPFELMEIDANQSWRRVLLNNSGSAISVSFIDGSNNPIKEIALPASILFEVQSTRTIKRGRLEEANFREDLIFPIKEFLPLLRTLDPAAQKALFPDPKWFLEKNYHVTRLGIMNESFEANPQTTLFGIEYETDFHTDILLIPVPLEVADNLLSQIEKNGPDNSEGSFNDVFEEPYAVKN